MVKKAPRGKFAVIAGKRRLQALSQLVEAGTLSPRIEVPCRVVVHEADLTEISLAENVQREPMHPADEFEAFRQLIEKGRCVADVAARLFAQRRDEHRIQVGIPHLAHRDLNWLPRRRR